MLAIVVSSIALVICAGSRGDIATAADKAPLGGGASILIDGRYCTLTTIGHDGAGDLVGFTAAHCGGPGSAVAAEGADGVLGTVTAADPALDYAVIKFDSTRVTPVADFGGFPINGIGPDPTAGQSACKRGGATGTDCRFIRYFLVRDPNRPGARIQATWQPGDDGGPVTSDDLLIGMIRTGSIDISIDTISQPQVRVTFFSAILADVNARGGSGAGFSPVPA